MKKIYLALAALAVAFFLPAPQSFAAEGPPSWCAQAKGGAPQCTYFTMEQCLAATLGTDSGCRVARGAYLIVTPVNEISVFMLGNETFRPLCAQVEGSRECMFFTLAQCHETLQGSADCVVKRETYLVTARLEAVTGLVSE